MNPIRFLATFLLISGLAGIWPTNATWALESTDEESVKMTYLAKLPKFIEWPASSQANKAADFTFCVLGDNELGAIRAGFEGQTVQKREVVVVDAKRQTDLSRCHALYIASSESWRAREVLAGIRSQPILSISSIDGFCAQGGIVALVRKEERLKFEINATAAKQTGLQISSQLLSLAIKVW